MRPSDGGPEGRRLVAVFVALGILVSACSGAAPSPSPGPSASSAVATSTEAASSAPSPASVPTVAPLAWAAILGEQRTFGTFAVFVDAAHGPNVLVVQENDKTVGFVTLDTSSAAAWTFDVSGPDGLARVASEAVETMRVDRTSSDPAGTFTPMPATEVAVGAKRGFRAGFAWKDHVGNLERSVLYVAAVPGGIALMSASAPPTAEELRPAFTDDATLLRFLPVLDQIIAGLRWPAG